MAHTINWLVFLDKPGTDSNKGRFLALLKSYQTLYCQLAELKLLLKEWGFLLEQ
jgi:hypothetical protein